MVVSPHVPLFALCWGSFFWLSAQAVYTPFIPQAFFFDYNKPEQPVPIPVTVQCDLIHIKWDRGVATGPNPTAPYSLQIYTSAFVFPFIIDAGSELEFDWAVPFAPGTQYQICMFDKNGNTGGCEAVYTVIPGSQPPTCANVTFPLGPLDIEAVVDNGPLSQYGWIDQCTDISVTPKNGTPPYTFTIAPALHPPFNITSDDMSNMNWTVSLSWGSPFFISVVDSLGKFWANGPLHSGGNGPTACLVGSDKSSTHSAASPAAMAGIGIGALVLGLLAGMFAAYFYLRHQQREELDGHTVPFRYAQSRDASYASSFGRLPSNPSIVYTGIPSTGGESTLPRNTRMNWLGIGSQYRVDPFVLPRDTETLSPIPRSPSDLFGTISDPPMVSRQPSQQNQVYVVHHDSGGAPVTVYHQNGTEVVELPPRYIHEASGSGNEIRNGIGERRSVQQNIDHIESSVLINQPRSPIPVRKNRAIR